MSAYGSLGVHWGSAFEDILRIWYGTCFPSLPNSASRTSRTWFFQNKERVYLAPIRTYIHILSHHQSYPMFYISKMRIYQATFLTPVRLPPRFYLTQQNLKGINNSSKDFN